MIASPRINPAVAYRRPRFISRAIVLMIKASGSATIEANPPRVDSIEPHLGLVMTIMRKKIQGTAAMINPVFPKALFGLLRLGITASGDGEGIGSGFIRTTLSH